MSGTQPVLLAWLMCDGVHADPMTGKHTLLGVFSSIRVREFPATHPRMFWFLSLTDCSVGQHELKISFGQDMSQTQPIITREFESRNPLHKINLINELRNLTIPAEANYAIVIEVDDHPILVTNLAVGN